MNQLSSKDEISKTLHFAFGKLSEIRIAEITFYHCCSFIYTLEFAL
jgi:hypothetical protein